MPNEMIQLSVAIYKKKHPKLYEALQNLGDEQGAISNWVRRMLMRAMHFEEIVDTEAKK